MDLLRNLTNKKQQIKSHVVFLLCFSRRNFGYFSKNDGQGNMPTHIVVTRKKGCVGGRRAI